MVRLKRLLLPLLMLLLSCGTALAGANPGKFEPAGEPAKTAQIVKIGFYPISVYALDISSSTYYLDTYVWLRWKGEIDPSTTLEFLNMVEEWGKQQETLLEAPDELPDGTKYQILRVEGRFVQPFSLKDFPLDTQQLKVLVENTKHGADQVAYVLDEKDSGVSEGLSIPGWDLTGWGSQTYLHTYGTKFGAEGGTAAATTFSAIEFSLNVSRPTSFFFWKLLLPLFVVLCAAWTVLLLDPKLVEVRTAMPATALLTTVFLQQAYSNNLPDIGYLVLIDRLYVVAYLLIIITLGRVIIVSRGVEGASESQLGTLQVRDKLILAIEVLVFVAATAALVTTKGA